MRFRRATRVLPGDDPTTTIRPEPRDDQTATINPATREDRTTAIGPDPARRTTTIGTDPGEPAAHALPRSRPAQVSVVYYSATGSVYAMAQAAAAGAAQAGAQVRLRRVRETAPAEAVASNEAWTRHARATEGVAVAGTADIAWADVILFGTPTRFGNVAAQLKGFIDSLGPLWGAGALVDKVFAGFVSTATAHGGQEATLLALYQSVYHLGGVVVAPGYADPVQFDAGNPYGASHISDNGQTPPGELELAAARFTAWRATTVGAAMLGKPAQTWPG